MSRLSLILYGNDFHMTTSPTPGFKTGFAVLVGRSNVGKSTLLNTLIGTKIAITTPKPQTTRQSIQGVLHREEGQVIFVDTPGIFQKKHDSLTDSLNRSAKAALQDIDVVVYVVDATRAIGPEEEAVMRMVKSADRPTVLAINKTDDYAKYLEDYRALSPDFDETVEISALRGRHIKPLIDAIMARLPVGEGMYPKDQITNVDRKFWHAELIREKLFLTLRQELPYATTVEVDEIEERETKAGEPLLYIHARILTDTDNHKKIIIGKGGATLKKIGSMTRRELEAVNDMKVFLDIDVERDPHWMQRGES